MKTTRVLYRPGSHVGLGVRASTLMAATELLAGAPDHPMIPRERIGLSKRGDTYTTNVGPAEKNRESRQARRHAERQARKATRRNRK